MVRPKAKLSQLLHFVKELIIMSNMLLLLAFDAATCSNQSIQQETDTSKSNHTHTDPVAFFALLFFFSLSFRTVSILITSATFFVLSSFFCCLLAAFAYRISPSFFAIMQIFLFETPRDRNLIVRLKFRLLKQLDDFLSFFFFFFTCSLLSDVRFPSHSKTDIPDFLIG